MTGFCRQLLLVTLLAASLLFGNAFAETYYDYAKVLSATPVTSTVYERSQKKVCQTVRAMPAIPDSDAAHEQTASLAAIIRQDLAAAHPVARRECRTEWVREPRTRTVAYEVRYRYGKLTYTRTMPTLPGDRIRVRVDIAPP